MILLYGYYIIYIILLFNNNEINNKNEFYRADGIFNEITPYSMVVSPGFGISLSWSK